MSEEDQVETTTEAAGENADKDISFPMKVRWTMDVGRSWNAAVAQDRGHIAVCYLRFKV